MVSDKSLDEVEIIAALLHDIQLSHGVVFSQRACRLTTQVVKRRYQSEGIGFLTKTLPRLGKAFDKAISGNTPLNSEELCFKTQFNSKLPRFLGEFFSRVLQTDGTLLPNADATCVAVIREVCYLFYKYKLPYSHEQEQQVIVKFEETERGLSSVTSKLQELAACRVQTTQRRRRPTSSGATTAQVVREAKIILSNLFSSFDPTDINPRHGPGAVSTKEQLWSKYLWTNISSDVTDVYPLDAYFYASLGHFCDDLESVRRLSDKNLPARVILVPKDSRGPRLISCEPVDKQWIQQGLGRAIVALVESHPSTKCQVNFTDQTSNRIAALYGSRNGLYATLDLAEASDRVSLDLVRLLFPEHLHRYFESCRSSSTVLPDGRELKLNKFAPMGSCLCFPILALTVFSILAAGAPDAYTRERILVYGDDVIVPTAYAANAIEHLESLGLKVNRDKSCTSGLFRESCGMDAFNGVDVTPVRLRTVWSSHPDPSVYTSWIAYANSFYDKRYFMTYDLIVGKLHSVYGAIPDESMHCACPSLRLVTIGHRPKRSRTNHNLQKREWYVWDVKAKRVKKDIPGWSKLLRYFSEVANDRNETTSSLLNDKGLSSRLTLDIEPFDASSYTKRRTSMLVRRWR